MARAKPFLGVEVFVNGERQCLAGARNHTVLSTIVSWARRPPSSKMNWESHLHVGGLTTTRARDGARTFTSWVENPDLRPGDEVLIRIVKTLRAEPPTKRVVRDDATDRESRRQTYLRLKEEFEPSGTRKRRSRTPTR